MDFVKKYDIEERAFEFACRVQRLEARLSRNPRIKKRSLDQLYSAASSIGANLEEARGAHSRADFHAKIRISLKEARESKYWLRLIARATSSPDRFEPIITEVGEIVAILTTIAKKTNPQK